MSDYSDSSLKMRSSLDTKSMEEKKPRKERLAPVVEGEVIRKKKSFTKRLIESIVKEDIPNIKDRIIEDVVIPNIQDALFNIANNALATAFGRSPSTSNRRNYNAVSTRTSMDRYYEDKRRSETRMAPTLLDEVIFPSRADAEGVIVDLQNTLDSYNVASVADYYDLANVTPEPQDFKVGWEKNWTNLDGLRSRQISRGYIIEGLPRPRRID